MTGTDEIEVEAICREESKVTHKVQGETQKNVIVFGLEGENSWSRYFIVLYFS